MCRALLDNLVGGLHGTREGFDGPGTCPHSSTAVSEGAMQPLQKQQHSWTRLVGLKRMGRTALHLHWSSVLGLLTALVPF